MQGYGFYTIEEHRYAPDGTLRSCGTENYKIPAVGNLPAALNVSLLKGGSNPKNIYSSKVQITTS